MVAHRGLPPDNVMVGWVFACQECAPLVYDSRIAIEYPSFEEDEK